MGLVSFQSVLNEVGIETFVASTPLYSNGLEFTAWERSPFSATVDVCRTGRGLYTRLRSTGILRGTLRHHPDSYLLWLMQRGGEPQHSQDRLRYLNRPLLICGPQERRHELANVSGLGLFLHRQLLWKEATLQGLGSDRAEAWLAPVRGDDIRRGSPVGEAMVSHLLLEIGRCLDQQVRSRTLLALEHALITVLLHHWAPSGAGLPGSGIYVHEAIDWLRTHLAEPIVWADLCTHLGISHRSLQLAFDRELQTSPSRWLKRERLARLRERLLDHHEGQSIEALARSCGLAYSSATLKAYRQLYQEKPSQTRRHRPS